MNHLSIHLSSVARRTFALVATIALMLGVILVPQRFGPILSPPTAQAAEQAGTSNKFSVELTLDRESVPYGGGLVKVTYTVTNNDPYYNWWYKANSNSLCDATPSGFEHYVAPGKKGTFSCFEYVTQTQDVEVSVTGEVWNGNAYDTETVTAKKRISVGDSGQSTCDEQWYTSFVSRDYPPTNYIGTLSSGGELTSKWSIPRIVNGGYIVGTGSAALAIDPTDPSTGYFTYRASGYYSGYLAKIDLESGEVSIVGKNADAFKTDRLTVDREGTLWTIARNGHLYSLPKVKDAATTPLREPESGEHADYKYVDSVNALNPVDHDEPIVQRADGTKLKFKSLNSGDLAFDGTGTLWLLASTGNNSDHTSLITIGPDELKKESGVVAHFVGGDERNMGVPSDANGNGNYFNGLSFGEDGTLFATSTDNSTGQSGYFEVNKDTGEPALIENFSENESHGFGDLASCALPQPNLSIQKEAYPQSAAPGDVITYKITFKNDGSLSAANVTFEDKVPAGTEYVEGSTKLNGNPVADIEGSLPYAAGPKLVKGSTTRFEGLIPAGDTATVEFKVRMEEGQTEVCNQGKMAYISSPDGVLTDDPSLPGSADKTCVKPEFSISKTAVADQKPILDDKNFEARYTVKVTNQSAGSASFGEVLDTPNVPDGFTITDVYVDQVDEEHRLSKKPDTDAYIVSEGGELKGKEEKTYVVIVRGTYDSAEVDWENAGKCTPGTGGGVSSGLANSIELAGDSDGPENNDACVPFEKPNSFDVVKTADREASSYDAGTFVAAYVLKVNKIGTADGGSFGQIVDKPRQIPGFEIVSVQDGEGNDLRQVSGDELTDVDASFEVSEGRQWEESDADTGFRVVVTYKAKTGEGAAEAEPSKDAVCKTDDDSSLVTEPSGAYNVVEMAGEPDDKTGNNDDCLPVPYFSVKKEDNSGPLKVDSSTESLTRKYIITVTNDSKLAGTSAPVLDTPNVPAGMTIKEFKVDGQVVTAQAGKYPVAPDGVTFAANGEPRTFDVEVTYAVDPETVKVSELQQCVSEDGSENPNALRNTVEMAGDPDTSDNVACTPVDGNSAFAVKKETEETPLTLMVGADTASRSYTVTVANSGTKSGTSKPVIDVPSTPTGFSVKEVKVDGVVVKAEADGESYKVTDGDTLEAGTSKAHIVEVTYSVNQSQFTKDSVAALGMCDASDASTVLDPEQGLHNLVILKDGDDADGTENNDSCVKVEVPLFRVQKEAKSKAPVVVNDGKFAVDYTVTVSNDGTADGSFKDITDELSLPEGFGVTAIKVTDEGGKTVAENTDDKSIVIPGASLNKGKSVVYTVHVEGTASAGAAGWASAEECKADGSDGPSKGLYNKVTMDGDADGDDNNDACVPSVSPKLTLEKLINGKMADSADEAVSVTPGEDMEISYEVTNSGSVKLFDVKVVDEVTVAKDDATKAALQEAIEAELGKVEAFDLAAGESKTVTITVKAVEGAHTNMAKAVGVPPSSEDPEKPGDPDDSDTPPVESPEDPGNTVSEDPTPTPPGSSVPPRIPFIPQIPLVPPLTPKTSTPVPPKSKAPTEQPMPSPAPSVTPTPVPEQPAKPKTSLAETGANVMWAVGAGLLLLLAGLALMSIRRRKDD